MGLAVLALPLVRASKMTVGSCKAYEKHDAL